MGVTSARAQHETNRKRPSRLAVLRGWLIATVALVLAVGTLKANSSYFYCAMMGETALEACCDHHGGRSEDAGYRAPDCCEGRNAGRLPAAHIVVAPDVPPAPLAFVAVAPTYRPAPVVRGATLSWLRWGSDPPDPSERRSQLMVFLT